MEDNENGQYRHSPWAAAYSKPHSKNTLHTDATRKKVCLGYEYLVLYSVCICRATSVSINRPVEPAQFTSITTANKMMTKLYFLIICFLLTEAAPAETAKEGDRRASQTTTSDHYIPCISTNKEIRHEMHKVINYCESLIIDTVIKNVTDLTNKEMKILERALPSISDSFNSSLQKLTRKINTLEQKLNQNSCKFLRANLPQYHC